MRITEKLKENYSSEIILLSVVCFLAGVVSGILLAPVKKGIAIFSYNGSNNTSENNVCDKTAEHYKHCKCSSDNEEDEN